MIDHNINIDLHSNIQLSGAIIWYHILVIHYFLDIDFCNYIYIFI